MRILLVEDDEKLNFHLRFQLEKKDFTVDSSFDGEDALYHIRQRIYDLVLLDRLLPRMDGLEVLRVMRQEGFSTPVILLTALGELQDKIDGLDVGADDYLVKPFDFEELMARIRSVSRRTCGSKTAECLTYGDITYYLTEYRLRGKQKECVLSKKEGQLLEVFIRSKEQVLSRELLLSKVWGLDSNVEDGNLDNYIHFIRRRIRSVDSGVQICTLRGIGYKLTFDGKDFSCSSEYEIN